MKIRHVALEKLKRAPGEHHAETESRVGRILLVDPDAPIREAPLDQQREQQAGRAGADDINLHSAESLYVDPLEIAVMFDLVHGFKSFKPFKQFKTFNRFKPEITSRRRAA